MARRKRGRREPNGRLSRRKDDVSERVSEVEREAKSVVIDARVKMWGMSREEAGKSTAGYFLGRLAAGKEVSPAQLTAAQYLIADRDAYQRAILSPGALAERHVGTGDETSYEKFCKRAKERWEAANEVIDECCREQKTDLPKQAIDMIVYRDISVSSHVGALRIVLNALSRHYLIGRRVAA